MIHLIYPLIYLPSLLPSISFPTTSLTNLFFTFHYHLFNLPHLSTLLIYHTLDCHSIIYLLLSAYLSLTLHLHLTTPFSHIITYSFILHLDITTTIQSFPHSTLSSNIHHSIIYFYHPLFSIYYTLFIHSPFFVYPSIYRSQYYWSYPSFIPYHLRFLFTFYSFRFPFPPYHPSL